MVADRIQEEGESVLHSHQYGSVGGRSAVDVLYRSVVEATKCLDSRGSVVWAFWEVKGGFQNVWSPDVLVRMAECTLLQCWNMWLERFMSRREFEVAWYGKVRGRGAVAKGVPQRSPLSPVLFLVYMALILEEMERHVPEEVGSVTIRFPSSVDDLHSWLYDRQGAEDEEGRRQRMSDLVVRVQGVVNDMGVEHELPLAADKKEAMVLGCDSRPKTRRGRVAEMVKWLGVILHDCLDFKEHWLHRIGKARSLFGVISGVGNSRWGIGLVSWRAAYIGMICAVAS